MPRTAAHTVSRRALGSAARTCTRGNVTLHRAAPPGPGSSSCCFPVHIPSWNSHWCEPRACLEELLDLPPRCPWGQFCFGHTIVQVIPKSPWGEGEFGMQRRSARLQEGLWDGVGYVGVVAGKLQPLSLPGGGWDGDNPLQSWRFRG